MYGVENDEDNRAKQLGEDYAGMFFAKDIGRVSQDGGGHPVDAGCLSWAETPRSYGVCLVRFVCVDFMLPSPTLTN